MTHLSRRARRRNGCTGWEHTRGAIRRGEKTRTRATDARARRVPVVEHNGDFYSCDHYVDEEHRLGNILSAPLVDLLESPAQRGFGLAKRDTLPGFCRSCDVLAQCGGECPKNRFIRTPDGEPGLNYLCAGYKRFFQHCRPFVEEIAAEWRRQQASAAGNAPPVPSRKPGRNEPCPCGSGKKYKGCCLGKT